MAVDFDWDPVKHEANLKRRSLGFDEAAEIFLRRTVEWIDDRHDYGEQRILALGMVNDRLVHVTYTVRGDTYWIISAYFIGHGKKGLRKLWNEKPS